MLLVVAEWSDGSVRLDRRSGGRFDLPDAATAPLDRPPCLETGPVALAPDQRCRAGQNDKVQFSPELRDRVADGTITVSYRRWSRPQVKVGGTYRSGEATIEVDELELLPFSSITDDDLARTGERDLGELQRRAAHAGPIHDDTVLYRVEFHVCGSEDEGR